MLRRGIRRLSLHQAAQGVLGVTWCTLFELKARKCLYGLGVIRVRRKCVVKGPLCGSHAAWREALELAPGYQPATEALQNTSR